MWDKSFTVKVQNCADENLSSDEIFDRIDDSLARVYREIYNRDPEHTRISLFSCAEFKNSSAFNKLFRSIKQETHRTF